MKREMFDEIRTLFAEFSASQSRGVLIENPLHQVEEVDLNERNRRGSSFKPSQFEDRATPPLDTTQKARARNWTFTS